MIKEQVAGLPTAGLCRKHGLSLATVCQRKARYGGMGLSDTKRLKQLEEVEPSRRPWFEPDGEGQAEAPGGGCHARGSAGKALTTPMQRRDAVLRAMKDRAVSQRRACALIGAGPKTVRRGHPPDNPEIRLEINKIAGKRRRFGCRRIGVLLERVGMVMNEKKLYRDDGGGSENSPGARKSN